jgi:hypothetical protein
MLNDLFSDPVIRARFEFWFFSYETGNPIPYSALQLRRALEQAVTSLDPAGRDAALRDMVLIGHSQGGLLAKMIAIDTGSRLWDQISTKPLDELRLQPETRELLRQSLFLKPEPFVGWLVFIATPAARQLPGGVFARPLRRELRAPSIQSPPGKRRYGHQQPGRLQVRPDPDGLRQRLRHDAGLASDHRAG